MRLTRVLPDGTKETIAEIPESVDAKALAEGMTKQDTILKIRPCVAEMCLMACPYTRPQE